MQKDNYEKLSEKIEKLNFHSYKERVEIQRNLEQIALNSQESLGKNGNLLKVIISLQILNLARQVPAVAEFLKLL